MAEGAQSAPPSMPDPASLPGRQLADALYGRIQSQIKQLQSQATKAEQVEVWYQKAGFQHEVLSLGYTNPDLIILYAVDAARRPSRILVHVNALELVLKIGEVHGNEEPRIVGFNGQVLDTMAETASGENAPCAKTCQPMAPQTNAY